MTRSHESAELSYSKYREHFLLKIMIMFPIFENLSIEKMWATKVNYHTQGYVVLPQKFL